LFATISSFDLIDFMFLVVLSKQNSSFPFANKISSFDWMDLFLVVVETNVKLFATISSFDFFCFWFVVETALKLLATISSFTFD
jgi:hypothetical protein